MSRGGQGSGMCYYLYLAYKAGEAEVYILSILQHDAISLRQLSHARKFGGLDQANRYGPSPCSCTDGVRVGFSLESDAVARV